MSKRRKPGIDDKNLQAVILELGDHSRVKSRKKSPPRISAERLEEMIEDATVDCYGEIEQLSGFYTMIEDNIALPFTTEVLGVEVSVKQFDQMASGEIVAVCRRDGTTQRVPILELPLPQPPPKGAEWIEALRHWSRGR